MYKLENCGLMLIDIVYCVVYCELKETKKYLKSFKVRKFKVFKISKYIVLYIIPQYIS